MIGLRWRSTNILTALTQRYLSTQKPKALRPKKGKSQSHRPPRPLIDQRNVLVVAGNGGSGCVSLLSVWGNEEAGPDGGDGGNGADVILQASVDVKDLVHMDSEMKAPDGVKGGNKHCHGANAKPLIIKVPLGTIVRRQDNGEELFDLQDLGDTYVAARGGMGGKGNKFFATDTNQTPQFAETGIEGERMKLSLEIRSMAHIGLIGFPNAGKSTLLQAISRARPKVAPYPFTTQQPFLGVVPFSDYQQLIVADLPGLVAGAHLNRGLGHAFLRHASRCLALLLVVDLAQPWPQPLDEILCLREELRMYSESLALSRPWGVAANKMDLPLAQENFPLLEKELAPSLDQDDLMPATLLSISARQGTNLPTLLAAMRKLYDDLNPDSEEDL